MPIKECLYSLSILPFLSVAALINARVSENLTTATGNYWVCMQLLLCLLLEKCVHLTVMTETCTHFRILKQNVHNAVETEVFRLF